MSAIPAHIPSHFTPKLQLRLEGIPPSKKNSHIIIVNKKTLRPMVIPSTEYRKWEKATASLLRLQANELKVFDPIEACSIELCYEVKDKRSWDLTNKTESVMDALVSANILKDDDRFNVQDIRIRWFPWQTAGLTISINY